MILTDVIDSDDDELWDMNRIDMIGECRYKWKYEMNDMMNECG